MNEWNGSSTNANGLADIMGRLSRMKSKLRCRSAEKFGLVRRWPWKLSGTSKKYVKGLDS
jgi:hypothetical protein